MHGAAAASALGEGCALVAYVDAGLKQLDAAVCVGLSCQLERYSAVWQLLLPLLRAEA